MTRDKNILQDAISNISGMDHDDINQLVRAIKIRRDQLHFQTAQSFQKGDRVVFTGKSGRTLTGTVEKIKIKYILVNADNGQRWNIPGGMLKLDVSRKVVA